MVAVGGEIMYIISAILLAFIAHEGGHYCASLFCGQKLHFRIEGFRVVWTMPSVSPNRQRLIAQAGFGCEFLTGLILALLLGTEGAWVDKAYLVAYWTFAVLHFWAYPWYAKGKSTDFKWMV